MAQMNRNTTRREQSLASLSVEWYGQSAFKLSAAEAQTVFIDPFGDLSAMASRGMQFDYPAIAGVDADLLLVTHEHADHNAVEAIGGEPVVLRSTAGRLESPLGEVLAVASEHDEQAGTARGPNTIFVFELAGVRVCHFGDFGQSTLREEQAAAIGAVDLLILPVGGGPTLGAQGAAAIVERLRPHWVVPMHYRTPRIGFLETADAFLELCADVHRLQGPVFQTGELPPAAGPLTVVPAAP
jgi:L-ascorbate metabolism protein UlaG (beta-lactamase superfamily)